MARSYSSASRAGNAALVVFWRVPRALVEEFEEFYDREHIPERMRVPGFLTGVRLVDLHDPTRQVALFDLADTRVLEGEAYRALGAAPTAWALRITRLCEVTHRLECSTGHESSTRSDLASSAAVRWIALLQGSAGAEAAVDALAAAPGTLRCRLLNARTPERSLVVADLIGPEAIAQQSFVESRIAFAASGSVDAGLFR